MDKRDYIMNIIRGNWFYLRRIKGLENQSEIELIPKIESAIKYLTSFKETSEKYSMNISNFAIGEMFGNNISKDSKDKMGVTVPSRVTLENKITKALGWTIEELYQISQKGEKIINEYRNL